MAIQQRTREKMKILEDYIEKYYGENLKRPTIREMEIETGIDHTTCNKLLKLIQEEKKAGKVSDSVTLKIYAADADVNGNFSEVGSMEIDKGMLSGSDTFILKRYNGNNRSVREGNLVIMELAPKAARKRK